MSKYLFPFVLFFAALAASAQEDTHFKCGNVQWYNQNVLNNPQMLEAEEQYERETRDFLEQNPNPVRDGSDPDYIIPVVFHVVHDYGMENISDAQIHDAMRILNNNFRKRNGDTSVTVPAFQSIAADSKIEFRLARKDPNGLCHNGIDRIASPQTYYGEAGSKLNPWPNDQYLNIWVVRYIQSGAAGYALLPYYAAFNPSKDGIMILHSYVGSIGTGSATRSAALTHEVGHYLNLSHTWGSTNDPGVSCGNDQVNDTPQTKGWTTCNLSGNVCNPGVVENVQNFMEYAYCSTMFTAGQRNRMHAALNSSTAGRSNLWSLGNLLATGTDHLTYAGCAPKPVLSPALTHFVCAGDTVFFDHFNTHGTATAWDWSFDGGTPAASSDSSVYSIYNAPGSYNVSLTTSNAAGSNGTTLLNYVQTLPATAHHPASGFVENFEGFSFAGSNWVVINPEGSGWTHTTNAGFSGNSSLRLSTAGQLENIPDHFITPTYDLSTVSDLTLYFRVAYAQREDGDIDNLRVYASTDCGQSWKLRYSKTGPTLSTTDDPVGGTFVPTASQWRQEAVNLNALAGETNVRFRFEFTNKGGNNVYIDDINFNPTTTVQDTRSELSLSVFPNPASGNDVALSFNLGQPADHASVTLVSAEGRTTEVMPPTRLDAGHHLLRLALNNVPAGYYMLWLRDGEKSWSSPVVIKR